MPDYMLTTVGRSGARDILVMDAATIRDAILLAEKLTGAPVDHGRTYHTHYTFDPAYTIDGRDGSHIQHHDNDAHESLRVVRPAGGPKLRKGQ